MKRRMDLQKEFKLATQSVSLMRAEISKNRETLETYREYKSFMDRLVPDEADPGSFYSAPRVLVGELDHVEACDLFLIDQCQEAGVDLDKRVGRVAAKLDETEGQVTVIERKVRAVPLVDDEDPHLTDGDVQAAAETDSELARFNRLISHAYKTYFGTTSNFSSLSMLKKIEAALERALVKLETVNPAFANTIQKKKDEERLEQQRLETQARKEAEQKLKYDQALERAKMPIKRRTGRPPVKRMLPNQLGRIDPEKSQAEALERARMEKLLYGPELT
jgi:hypothetical protein